MCDADAVREYVLDAHRETLVAVLACADAVDLERELQRAGALGTFPDLLAGAVAAAGYELPATPVAAPPYVAVTSLGPVARATLADGRLVIAVEAFGVERGERARYVRRAREPEAALVVEFR